jgi:hypothetical protein
MDLKSRNPYHTESASPGLRPSVLAFFDILGYSDMAKEAYEADAQAETLIKLHAALMGGRKWLGEMELDEDFASAMNQAFHKDRYAIKAFTDNIVIGWPIRDDAESELGEAFLKLVDFQFHMTVAGFFIRGGIAIGDAFVDDVVVFGNALTEAYEAETKIARDPRIVLAESVIEPLKTHIAYYNRPQSAPQTRALLRDADGQLFLNYLEAVLYAADDVGPAYGAFLEHKAAVESKLSQTKSRPAIWSKYAWVAGYHNYFCEMNEHLFDDTHKIDVELFRGTPTRINFDKSAG